MLPEELMQGVQELILGAVNLAFKLTYDSINSL